LLDIRHKIVNFRVSIPDKGKKTRTDENATTFLKKENLLSHDIHAYHVKLLELQNFYICIEWFYFRKFFLNPLHLPVKNVTKWNKVKRFYFNIHKQRVS